MRAETYDNLQQGYRSDGKQLAPTHFLARCGVTDSATIANVQRISLDGRGDAGHGSCGNNWRLRTIYHLIDYR
jgi:hypothetical protein